MNVFNPIIAEQQLRKALKGRFYLVDGTDKNRLDEQIAEARRYKAALAAAAQKSESAACKARKLMRSGETSAAIMSAVSAVHGVDIDVMISSNRTKAAINARFHAVWLIRERTGLSLPRIGIRFGHRDHSTILHGVQSWTRRMHQHADKIDAVNRMLEPGA